MHSFYKGASVFEILLSVFTLTLIGGISLYVINFNQEVNHLRNLQIQSEMNVLLKNIHEYVAVEGSYPAAIPSSYTPICDTNIKTNCIQFNNQFISDYLYMTSDNLNFQSSYQLALNPSDYRISAKTQGADGKTLTSMF